MKKNNFQIFSDGKRVAFVVDGTAYLFESEVCEANVSASTECFDVTTEGDDWRCFSRGNTSARFDVSFQVVGSLSVLEDFRPIDMGIMQNATILELFTLIEKKSKERG